jgi:hypothetical protein
MFYEVRIPNIKTNELKLFISTICTNEKIDITDETINDLIQMTEHNITKIMLNLQFFKQTNRFLTYSKTQIDDILELVYENKNENILKIREKLYTLTAKNFNKSILINYALKKVLSKLTCQEKKMNLINEVSKIDLNLKHSYKDLIHVEYFFILLMNYID